MMGTLVVKGLMCSVKLWKTFLHNFAGNEIRIYCIQHLHLIIKNDDDDDDDDDDNDDDDDEWKIKYEWSHVFHQRKRCDEMKCMFKLLYLCGLSHHA